VGGSWQAPGSAPALYVVGGSPLLRPEEQVFEAMLDGWRNQQLARGLSVAVIEERIRLVRRFQQFTNEWPWRWAPGDADDFAADLRHARRAQSTIRGYQAAARMFCDYVADPRYEWTAACELILRRCSSSGTPRHTTTSTKAGRLGEH
jgi:integrase/recombinase XerC